MIHNYKIRNKKHIYGVLHYDDKKDQFTIDFDEKADLTNPYASMYITEFAKKGLHIGPDLARMWVEDRVIPPDRQNISDILKAHNLSFYTPHDMLVAYHGRCTHDDLYIEKID